MRAAEVWVAKDDGSDIVRVAAIAGVGRDYDGNVTARLSGGEQSVVTLVAHHGPPTPDDFHLQLLRMISQLSDTAESAVIRPLHDELRGWHWRSGPLQDRRSHRRPAKPRAAAAEIQQSQSETRNKFP